MKVINYAWIMYDVTNLVCYFTRMLFHAGLMHVVSYLKSRPAI